MLLLITVPPIPLAPRLGEAGPLLGRLLGAQAAITALTLAVTVFVLQSIGGRRDVDDRTYREYVRRSRVRPIFWGSVAAVGATGLVLLADEFLDAAAPVREALPGLRNLALLAAVAFAANLVLSVALFERAIRLSGPDQWRALRLEVDENDVREAVRVFLRRRRREATAPGSEQAGTFAAFSAPGGGSADEAIRALLDDARRAMDERRQVDFERALDAIMRLLAHAMDEIENQGIEWAAPGSQPRWPPLAELSRNLYPFREAVIREGGREYVFAFLRLDNWLLTEGILRRCGELFTVGLDGYRWSYQIAGIAGRGEWRELFRDRVWRNAGTSFYGLNAEDAFSFLRYMIRHEERLLSDAMDADRRVDYERLHAAFSRLLRRIGSTWRVHRWPRPASAELYARLEQDHRIALMGLAGRAVFLADSGRIADAAPYLDAARGEFGRLGLLADDLERALASEDRRGFSLWSTWEMEGADDFETRAVNPDRYPLAFFSMRLLELATDQSADLDMGGNAQRVLNWFTQNSERLAQHVRGDAEASWAVRSELVLDVLRAAVHRDDVAADEEIIRLDLSPDRIAAFTADVYATAFAANTIESLFAAAGAMLYLPHDTPDAPGLRRLHELEHKGFLAEAPENSRTHFSELRGDDWGRAVAHDGLERLCEMLDGAPAIVASLDSVEDLLRAIDAALAELAPRGGVLVLLAGEWGDLLFDLNVQPPNGYEPAPEEGGAHGGEGTARYRGHPVITGHEDGRRRVYIVEPGAWGCFLRAQVEGATDLLVAVDTVSAERARVLLSATPGHFPDQPDESSKLRKLQTCVEVRVVWSTTFRVADRSRARRISADVS